MPGECLANARQKGRVGLQNRWRSNSGNSKPLRPQCRDPSLALLCRFAALPLRSARAESLSFSSLPLESVEPRRHGDAGALPYWRGPCLIGGRGPCLPSLPSPGGMLAA